MKDYNKFLEAKTHMPNQYGFSVKDGKLNDKLFDWQKYLVQWSLKKGRSSIFADCGLGKSFLQLEWAKHIVEKTNKPIIILTPLAVAPQTISEGKKFNINDCYFSKDGKIRNKKIIVTNYEKLHYFNSNDFIGIVCDESSAIKHFQGKRQKYVTEFMKKLPYRLLCTATPSPNDHMELGTSSEALGELGYMDMLNRFFKNDQNNSSTGRHFGKKIQWRFKKHAEEFFWKWISSWSRALRKPSDIGNYSDSKFILPDINYYQHEIKNTRPHPGQLLPMEAIGLREERQELRMTLEERCEKVAELVNSTNKPFVAWCQLNDEGDLLEKLIPDAVQVAGKHSDEIKEERLTDFTKGNIRGLITKSKIAGFGLNWQHCAHMTFFPSHSFEQWYQSIRRCYRFRQKNNVNIDIITTPGMKNVLKNLQRKSDEADKMFSEIIKYMNDFLNIKTKNEHKNKMEVAKWLKK